ncbi:MAG TPA: DUF6069 family protein [Thermomicrobiaceae bacterium]|nr:DUF6069 family protein [Thermomicrobiaceae bacterium]
MHSTVLDRIGSTVTGRPVVDVRGGAIPLKRLARAASAVGLVAAVVDLLIYAAAGRWGVPGAYAAVFNPASIVVVVAVGVVVDAIGLAVLARVSRRPGLIFRVLAAAVTLLSLGTPLGVLAGTMPGYPAATPAIGIVMILMHLITGGAIAVLLPALVRR